jgi:hypothetical protein
MSKLRIIHIERHGEIIPMQIEPYRYDDQRIYFFRETGIELPPMNRLEKIGNPEYLRALIRRVYRRVYLSDSRWFAWELLPGYVWDLASVPKFARWFLDNDDPDLSGAAIVHDPNYTGHFLGDDIPGLDLTNWLFREMIRYTGKRARANAAYFFVNGIIGRSLYWKAPKRCETLQFVKFSSGNF